MFEQIKNFFRKRKIRKLSRAVPTGLLPLSEISTVNFVIDVEENEYDLLKEDILAWGRAEDKKVAIYYFDFRKLNANELLLTSIQTTVARAELNWFGMPSYEKVAPLIEEQSDLFISMIDSTEFPVVFLSNCSKARFKIGRRAYEGHVFDMVVTGNETAELRSDSLKIFNAIKDFLNKIK